jgi:hypothetical protein
LAAGETCGILDNPYLRAAHQRRQRILEAASSAALDGRPTEPERLYAFLGDIPLRASRHVWGEEDAAKIFHALIDPPASELGREARAILAGATSQAGDDFLALAGVIFRGHEGNTAAGRLALALALRKLAGAAEPAMSAVLHGLQAACRRPLPAFEEFVSTAFYKACVQSRDRARALRASVAASLSALKNDRADSRIHGIAALLFAGHPLTYAGAAARFGITDTAAVEHVSRLVELGLAEAAVRRKTGQVFIARDGVMTFNAPASPAPKLAKSRLRVSLPSPLTPEDRERLAAASDEVAADIAELDRVLARFSSAKTIG